MLNTWVSIFETLKKQVAAVNQASKLVQTRLATVNGKVSSTKASVCKGTACKSPTVTAHFGKSMFNLQPWPIPAYMFSLYHALDR